MDLSWWRSPTKNWRFLIMTMWYHTLQGTCLIGIFIVAWKPTSSKNYPSPCSPSPSSTAPGAPTNFRARPQQRTIKKGLDRRRREMSISIRVKTPMKLASERLLTKCNKSYFSLQRNSHNKCIKGSEENRLWRGFFVPQSSLHKQTQICQLGIESGRASKNWKCIKGNVRRK